jgi:hypothetical protein
MKTNLINLSKFIKYFLLFLIISCSGTKKVQKDEPQKDNKNTNKNIVKDARYNNDPLVSSYDVNKDGNADMWKIYKSVKVNDTETKQVLSRREIDLNFDGNINYYKFYTEKGNIDKEYLDLDLNGVLDCVRYYENNQITKEDYYSQNPMKKDLSIDENVKVYKKALYSNNKITRILVDRTNNGYLDEYLFFKKNELIQIGFDEDEDGKIDTRVRLKEKETKKDEPKNDK